MLSVRVKKEFVGGREARIPFVRKRQHEEYATEAQDPFTLNVAFDAPPGVAILFGASGSGKTLTLKSIAGIVRPDAGHIAVNGETLFDSERRINLPIRARGAGYVFQSLALFPHLTARGQIEFALNGLPKRERASRALELLRAFRIEHVAPQYLRHISGGEAQRVALARALANRPRMLLLDEPLSALDEANKLSIIADLKRVNRELRLPIIYVTHSREEAVMLGERVYVYERGRIVAAGEPVAVLGSPVKTSVARLTGVENIFTGYVVARDRYAGIMTVQIGGEENPCRIDVPFGHQQTGERVTLAVRSGDILLATVEPRSTTARNVLPGRIAAIEERSDRILVRVRSGVEWVVSVTRQALEELQLAKDSNVWLAIKTYSCYLLDREDER